MMNDLPSMQIQVGTQLALFLANRIGALTDLCELLAKSDINIYALTTSDTVDHVVIRMVVDKPRVAIRVLEAQGALVIESEVILLEAPSKTGGLSHIARLLAEGGVNIEYVYSATPPSAASQGLLVFRPSSLAKALKILNQSEASTPEKKASKKERAA